MSPPEPTSDSASRLPLEPMDPQISSIQPGGGVCMRLELAWGHVRRALLRTFCPAYVERMRASRLGDPTGCPHEVIDSRDLKYYRNQVKCWWEPDRFAWRDRLPFARAGLAELLLLASASLALAAIGGWLWWPIAIVPILVFAEVVWFFRNPRRTIPEESGLVVSPADGKVVAIDELEFDEYVGGPALRIGIFLSIFNVHINRVPVECRVIGLTYRRGKFLNALRPASVRENEQLAIRIEENRPPYRRMIVRQIAGAIARRIVCWSAPGDVLGRGEQFGMIKLGSRTELVIPRDETLRVVVKLGENVQAGSSVMARYE